MGTDGMAEWVERPSPAFEDLVSLNRGRVKAMTVSNAKYETKWEGGMNMLLRETGKHRQ